MLEGQVHLDYKVLEGLPADVEEWEEEDRRV